MTGKLKEVKDLRDMVADPQKERWYNSIVLHIPYDMDKVFAPEEKKNNIKVIMTNKQYDGTEMDELLGILDEHSLLIDCYTTSLMEADVCITTNRDWSRPSKFALSLIIYSLKQLGYKVNLNRPFRFATSPELNFTYNSIGLVINDCLYDDKEKAKQLRNHLTSIYNLLTKYWEQIKD